jgi:hypothetical protein
VSTWQALRDYEVYAATYVTELQIEEGNKIFIETANKTLAAANVTVFEGLVLKTSLKKTGVEYRSCMQSLYAKLPEKLRGEVHPAILKAASSEAARVKK